MNTRVLLVTFVLGMSVACIESGAGEDVVLEYNSNENLNNNNDELQTAETEYIDPYFYTYDYDYYPLAYPVPFGFGYGYRTGRRSKLGYQGYSYPRYEKYGSGRRYGFRIGASKPFLKTGGRFSGFRGSFGRGFGGSFGRGGGGFGGGHGGRG